MKEYPRLLNDEMVRAVLSGRKTQTRWPLDIAPRIQVGDILWVREAWRVGAWDEENGRIAADYRADGYCRHEWLKVPDPDTFDRLWWQSSEDAEKAGLKYDEDGNYHWKPGQSPCRWRPSIHMPRWACRMLLEVTRVWAEMLTDISEDDAEAEGVAPSEALELADGGSPDYVLAFRVLWDSIYAKRGYGWADNPVVRAAEFRLLQPRA